jgi:hypothetical protein
MRRILKHDNGRLNRFARPPAAPQNVPSRTQCIGNVIARLRPFIRRQFLRRERAAAPMERKGNRRIRHRT